MQEELMKAQLESASHPIEFPELPAAEPMPPPPPPPSSTSQDVTEAEQEARRQAGRRLSPGKRSILAGETGGYRNGGTATMTAKKSILG
jgi:hypothetical protein